MKIDAYMDDDILGPVERRMRAQNDANWLSRCARSHRKYAEMAIAKKLQQDHTDLANRYEQAALRAKAIYDELRKME